MIKGKGVIYNIHYTIHYTIMIIFLLVIINITFYLNLNDDNFLFVLKNGQCT